jgi:hypothetical protein
LAYKTGNCIDGSRGIEAPWEVDRVELKLGKGAGRLHLGVPGDQRLILLRHE